MRQPHSPPAFSWHGRHQPGDFSRQGHSPHHTFLLWGPLPSTPTRLLADGRFPSPNAEKLPSGPSSGGWQPERGAAVVHSGHQGLQHSGTAAGRCGRHCSVVSRQRCEVWGRGALESSLSQNSGLAAAPTGQEWYEAPQAPSAADRERALGPAPASRPEQGSCGSLRSRSRRLSVAPESLPQLPLVPPSFPSGCPHLSRALRHRRHHAVGGLTPPAGSPALTQMVWAPPGGAHKGQRTQAGAFQAPVWPVSELCTNTTLLPADRQQSGPRPAVRPHLRSL